MFDQLRLNEAPRRHAPLARAAVTGQRLRRVLVYLEIANQHRNPIVAGLARALLAAGIEVRIACELRAAYRLDNADLVRVDCEKHIREHFTGELESLLHVRDVLAGARSSASESANQRRRTFIGELVEQFQPDRVLIWNGKFPFQKATIHSLHEFGYADRTLFAEVAWFSQKDFVYIDAKGVNLHSSIYQRPARPLSPTQHIRLDQWYARLRSGRIGTTLVTRRPGPMRIFIPLQVDTDTSIREGSPFADMQAFIRFLEGWVPAECEVILKAHPKAHYPYVMHSRRNNFHLRASGTVDEFIADTDCVMGVNSTVLLEAAALGKNVVAFGRGLFTGCGVLTEAKVEDNPLDALYRPIDEAARASFFYHLVFERQISIARLRSRDAAHLFSREPFCDFVIDPALARRVFTLNAQEGKSMIKVGKSKIAQTASLDVEKGGQITIGDDSEVRHHAVLEVSGRYNGTIEIGNHCVVGVGDWMQGSGKIRIGNDVIIGPYVAIVSTNHTYEDASTPVAKQPLQTGEVVIEDDVWIGAHCTIAQNVKIGAHSIIGANSFVNKDIPPYSIAAGSPAKLIRTRK